MLGLVILALATPLAGTEPLTFTGDPVQAMIPGIQRILEQRTAESPRNRKPSVDRLKQILGLVDQRVAPSLEAREVARNGRWTASAVRWRVLEGLTAEGLMLAPVGPTSACVVMLPDADQEPEAIAQAQQLASAGARVLAPVLIDRGTRWSGNPAIRMTNQSHREFIHRMAWPLGRTIIGYEMQKAMAGIDWCVSQGSDRIGLWGYGEGGGIALYTAAVDPRVNSAVVSGYFGPREDLWRQPLDRNVWSILRDFGDAELARMAAPRKVFIEAKPGPTVAQAPALPGDRDRAAPGVLQSRDAASAAEEARRAGLTVHADALAPFAESLGLRLGGHAEQMIAAGDAGARRERQFREMVAFTQALIVPMERARAKSLDDIPTIKRRFEQEMIGRLRPSGPPNARTRLSYSSAKWDGYEVMLDVMPGLFAYGVLLMPKQVTERRPLVVVQHGLDGRPQMLFGLKEGRNLDVYVNMGEKLADEGFIVYLPQNPYVGDFRHISRLATPLGLSMFSFITAQHERALEWLSSLPAVDAQRIGYYGLSYGGATAMRVPPLLDQYRVVVCAGNFNEWIRKLVSPELPYSYVFTHEYEILEFNQAGIASHAEMALMIAPRPFLVERGHRDGVGEDEWVAYEYAKVKRYYDEHGWADRVRIAWFNGPHRFDGAEAIPFLRKHLN